MWMLSAQGYIERNDSNMGLDIVQSASAITCLWMLMTFIPAGVALLTMRFVWLYPLGTSEMDEIVAKLRTRREKPVTIDTEEFVEPA